jgi:hypothetical protein
MSRKGCEQQQKFQCKSTLGQGPGSSIFRTFSHCLFIFQTQPNVFQAGVKVTWLDGEGKQGEVGLHTSSDGGNLWTGYSTFPNVPLSVLKQLKEFKQASPTIVAVRFGQVPKGRGQKVPDFINY